MFVCAGESESFAFARPIGIGMIDAAINLTKICDSEKPDKIIFVGTAGSYGNKEIFDIVESSRCTNIENGYFDGKTYTPVENKIDVSNHDDNLGVSRETFVNSSNYITTDINSAEQYLEHGIELENMEFYSVLKVSQTFGVPAYGIFIVTNYCNSSAHEDFLSRHKESMNRLTKYIEEKYE